MVFSQFFSDFISSAFKKAELSIARRREGDLPNRNWCDRLKESVSESAIQSLTFTGHSTKNIFENGLFLKF